MIRKKGVRKEERRIETYQVGRSDWTIVASRGLLEG